MARENLADTLATCVIAGVWVSKGVLMQSIWQHLAAA